MNTLYKKMKTLLEGLQDSHLEAEAADPSTHPDKLHAWHDHINPVIRANVANNPNTPLPTLIKMAVNGEKIQNNPALPMFQLENPGYLNHLSYEQIEDLVKHNANPDLEKFLYDSYDPENSKTNIIARYTSHPDVLNKAYADSFNGTGEDGISWHKRNYLAANNNTLPSILNALYNTEIEFDKKSKNPLGHNQNLHSYLARNKNTPEHILHKYANDSKFDGLFNLAANPNLTSELFNKIERHPNFHIDQEAMEKIIRHPKVTDEVLQNIVDSDIDHTHLQNEAYRKLQTMRKKGGNER